MRIVAFLTLILLLPLVPLYVAVILLGLYAIVWPSVEVVVLAAGVDAFFGAQASLPLYLLSATGLVLLSILVRPHLMFYNQ